MPLSQSEFTLPLQGRRIRRSLETNVTRIIARLRQKELDDIINKLNRTITGNVYFKLLHYNYLHIKFT